MNVTAASWGKAVRTFSADLVDNPVVAREFRTRMRGWRAFMVMGAYVLFLTVVMLITFAGVSAMSGYYSSHGGMMNIRVGGILFGSITWTQTILLTLVIPALASGALSREIENKTIELLVLTNLRPSRIVLGKFLAGYLYSLMLLLCSLPVAGICVMFGGISPGETATVYGSLAAWAFLLVSVAVFWSALLNRTMTSALLSYASGGLYLLVMSVVIANLYVTGAFGGGSPGAWSLAAFTPGWALNTVGKDAVICGLGVPPNAIAIVYQVLFGSLLLTSASMHVRHKRIDKSLPVRVLLILVTAIPLWALLGDRMLTWINSLTVSDVQGMLGLDMMAVPLILACFAPLLATGAIRRVQGQSLLQYALSWTRAFRGDMGGAIAFMAVWSAVLSAVVGGTIYWSAKAYKAPIPANYWVIWLKLTLTAIIIMAAIACIGILASSLVKRRREAVALSILVVVCIFGIYGGIVAFYDKAISNNLNPIWQMAAFWPLTPFGALAGQWGDHLPPLLLNPRHYWLVVGAVYALIGMGALGLASLILRKRPGVQEE